MSSVELHMMVNPKKLGENLCVSTSVYVCVCICVCVQTFDANEEFVMK